MEARFYHMASGDRTITIDVIAALAAMAFRETKGGRVGIFCRPEDAEVIKQTVWKVKGFVPCALLGESDWELCPIVVFSGSDAPLAIDAAVNADPMAKTYPDAAMQAGLLIDFIDECLAGPVKDAGRNRFRTAYALCAPSRTKPAYLDFVPNWD